MYVCVSQAAHNDVTEANDVIANLQRQLDEQGRVLKEQGQEQKEQGQEQKEQGQQTREQIQQLTSRLNQQQKQIDHLLEKNAALEERIKSFEISMIQINIKVRKYCKTTPLCLIFA